MKLLIVDDHSVVRQGVRLLLSSNPDVAIYEACSGNEALTLFREQRPNLLLLDLNLSSSSGLELLGRLLKEDKAARILIFSMHSEPFYVVRALKAGASGYISKGADPSELLTAIDHVAKGGQYVEREIAGRLLPLAHHLSTPGGWSEKTR
jgi:two-component system, NarL family, invasion response regulator UvrY